MVLPLAAATMEPEETKVIYHVGEEATPYRVKVSVPPSRVTLGDLKAVVKRDGFKFFFKTQDDDVGFVKEEVNDDEARLPLFNDKVECYLEQSLAGSVVGGASAASQQQQRGALSSLRHPRRQDGEEEEESEAASDSLGMPPPGLERGPGVGETRPPSFQ